MKGFPSGFRAWGLHSGIGKNKSKPDLALFYSERPAAAAGVFTKNKVKAAPVVLSRDRLRRGRARAVLINSGCANACTGRQGFKDARQSASLAASGLGVSAESVLVASTGVIGQALPMTRLQSGLARLCRGVSQGKNDPLMAVRAMMTTDTFAKFEARRAGGCRLWGCVKGAGMIHPDMATMIAVVLTDAALASGRLKSALKRAVDQSFNCASVDGDTSTNDCVFLLANGASGKDLRAGKDLDAFERELAALCASLSRKMVSDGEGATKRVEIFVSGARSGEDAKKVARTVATSPLVKTAVFGNDANWGRIIAAVGRSGAALDPEKVSVSFDGLAVARRGEAVPFSEKRGREILKKKVVPVEIRLGLGKGSARYWTCDFSFDYVKINAEYRT